MKSTMMSSPLLLTGMLERAAKLFPNVEIVSVRWTVPDIATITAICIGARDSWLRRLRTRGHCQGRSRGDADVEPA